MANADFEHLSINYKIRGRHRTSNSHRVLPSTATKACETATVNAVLRLSVGISTV